MKRTRGKSSWLRTARCATRRAAASRASRRARKRAAGLDRPTDYKPEYWEQIIEFFDVEPERVIELYTPHHQSGRKCANQERVEVRPPTLERVARSIGTTTTTINEQIATHPEFAVAVRAMKGMAALAFDFSSSQTLSLYAHLVNDLLCVVEIEVNTSVRKDQGGAVQQVSSS